MATTATGLERRKSVNPVNDPLVVRFTYDNGKPKFRIINQDESLMPRNRFKWRCDETRLEISSCNNPELRLGATLYLRGSGRARDNEHPCEYRSASISDDLDEMAKAVRNLNNRLKQQQIERTEVPF